MITCRSVAHGGRYFHFCYHCRTSCGSGVYCPRCPERNDKATRARVLEGKNERSRANPIVLEGTDEEGEGEGEEPVAAVEAVEAVEEQQQKEEQERTHKTESPPLSSTSSASPSSGQGRLPGSRIQRVRTPPRIRHRARQPSQPRTSRCKCCRCRRSKRGRR